MNLTKLITTIALVGSLFVAGCSEEKIESKNMEQLHSENGVPVKVEKIQKGEFHIEFTYNSMLTGLKESSAYANVGDRIEKVFAKVGDHVKKDQVLATFPTDNPSAKYYQAKAAYDLSVKSYERYKNLFEAGGISENDLDNVKTQMDVNKANFDAVSKLVKVKSPITGYITKVNVRESDNVKKENLLFTVADVSKLKTKINVSENEIEFFKPGLPAKANWNNQIVQGKVTEVDVAMNPMTQAFSATVEFDNSKNLIKAGTTADICVNVNGHSSSIVIDRKNIKNENGRYYTFVASGDKAVKKEIKLGRSYGVSVEVVEGLTEGENLVVEGTLLLDNNKKINIVN